MKPLVVLLVCFCLAILATRFYGGGYDYRMAGRIAMSVMLLFTALGHFMYPKGMALMVPEVIPFRETLVYVTGLIEIAAAIGLLVGRTRALTGWLLILFFGLILPANIYAAVKRVNFQTADYNGEGLAYLWFRVPLQIVFVLWVYFFAIR